MSPAGKHTCDFENPPGGTMTCSADQLAFCRVKDGRPKGECLDVPPSPAFSPQYENIPLRQAQIAHLVELVTELRPEFPVSIDDISMLLSGRYEDPERNYVVNFRLPDHIRRKLEDARDQDQGGGLTSDNPPDMPRESPPKIRIKM